MSSPLYGVGLPQEARARVLAKIRCAVVGPDWVRLGAVHVKCRVMNLTQFADLDILYKDYFFVQVTTLIELRLPHVSYFVPRLPHGFAHSRS